MAETYYFCLDDEAMKYALMHYKNRFTEVLRCLTTMEMEIAAKKINENKQKIFYSLRCGAKNFIKTEIKNLEILSSLHQKYSSNHLHNLFLRLGIVRNIPLSGCQRTMPCKHSHIIKSTTDKANIFCRIGYKSSPSAM